MNRFRFRNDRGQTLTEFALVLPILAVLLFAIAQFGVVFNDYISLTNGVRVGARKAVVSRRDPAPDLAAAAAVRNAADDLDPAQLQVTVTPPPWNPGNDVNVTASYPYAINILGVVVKSGRISASTTERVE
jgi:Flp pilus assembly protein TadG